VNDRKGIALPDEPEDDRVTEQMFREAGMLKVEDGVEYDPLSLRAAQHIERTYDSVPTLIDEPVPWRFWKRVAHRIGKSNTHWTAPELREAREAAIAFCRCLVRNRVDGMTPFRAQQELHDSVVLAIPPETPGEVLVQIHGKFSEAMRAFKDACYIEFQNEYLGRRVG
jgi:hypothetical protein